MSAENEIRNIKLFEEEIRNIKQMAFDAAHPVGETYTQYPQQDDPMTLYNKNGVTSVWQQQTQYSGAFFRSSNAPTAVYKNDDETDYYIQDSVTGELVAIQASSNGGPTIADTPSGESIWYKGKEYKRYIVTASTRYANDYIDKTNSLSIQGSQNISHYHRTNAFHRHYVNVSGGNHQHSFTLTATCEGYTYAYIGSSSAYTSGYTSWSGDLSLSGWDNNTIYNSGGSQVSSGATWNIQSDSRGGDEARPNNYTVIVWKRIY